ncbi:MAG: DoxX family membrane protein [Ktedonobacterales bacterium]
MRQRTQTDMALMDGGLLGLRLTLGGFMLGHGAQKLFGAFEGPGIEGARQMMEAQSITPSKPWAIAAGAAEFGGGALTTLGLLSPLGSLAVLGSMGVATFKTHWGKPIWVSSGGAELPVTNIALASALMLTGPGTFSLDEALGVRLPRWLAIPGIALVAAGVVGAIFSGQIASRINQLGNSSQTATISADQVSGGPAASTQQQADEASRTQGEPVSFSI